MGTETRSISLWFARWGWIALSVALVAGAVVWASAPLRRREILFEAPMRIVPGASIDGRFTPDHRGPFTIELRFHEAWLEPLSEKTRGGQAALEALGRDIGGGWYGERSLPPGFTASYSVRTDMEAVANGVTGDHLTGFFGPREVGVHLAGVRDGRPSPHEFHVHIDRAVEALKKRDARVVVAASGDWISYRSLEALVRMVVAGVVVSVGLVLLGLLRTRIRESASRSDVDVPNAR